ncbi:hypothetical protein HCU64_06400 [Methylobacterium sp. C25]|uniref:DUF6894 family protein n=1 Tax=Methylobacterium sp. C25 TaxID=2721622 RepID=UPI001F258714|nr:hypothetical protein [Methylobacterium sp. C25]MCE4223376.1 hypothetical protein [Methylobacterium sp. C25]
MTRFYFDQNRSGKRTEDTVGIEFATAEEADRHALSLVKAFIQDVEVTGRMTGMTVSVHTEDYSTSWSVASTVRRIGSLKPNHERAVRPGTESGKVQWLMDRGETNDRVVNMAVDAYLADPTRRWFEISSGYDIDLAAAVQAFRPAADSPTNWLLVRSAIVRAPIRRR